MPLPIRSPTKQACASGRTDLSRLQATRAANRDLLYSLFADFSQFAAHLATLGGSDGEANAEDAAGGGITDEGKDEGKARKKEKQKQKHKKEKVKKRRGITTSSSRAPS